MAGRSRFGRERQGHDMDEAFVIEIVQRAVLTTLQLAAPVLILSLLAGFLISLLQAVTQINEPTLTFLPKILAAALAIFLFFPWMLSLIVSFKGTPGCDGFDFCERTLSGVSGQSATLFDAVVAGVSAMGGDFKGLVNTQGAMRWGWARHGPGGESSTSVARRFLSGSTIQTISR